MQQTPDLISVIMGIYNCEKTLPKAIESILAQTYSSWELIMCDDGSSDGTCAVAQKYAQQYPDKIILIQNETNKGLNVTLNHCLQYAHGEYVARQDGDDWSLPERFEKELQYLKQYPQCSFVSTSMIVNNGEKNIAIRHQSMQFPTKEGFMKANQFHHATIIIRYDAIMAVNGYSEDERLLRVEDFNLWTKLYAKGYQGCNLKEGLYVVVEDQATYSRRKLKYRINGAYAKSLAIKMLNLPKYNYIYVIYGIAKGFVPNFLYKFLHTKKIERKSEFVVENDSEANN